MRTQAFFSKEERQEKREAHACAVSSMAGPRRRTTFVLVHGAWHGGWVWERVAHRLRTLGHRVYAPTTLRMDPISAATHVCDLLSRVDAAGVIVVGHSYGGMIVRVVAELCPRRIARLVFVDAFVPRDAQCVFDLLAPSGVERLRARAGTSGWMPPFTPEEFGLRPQSDEAALVRAHAKPMPLRAYETRVRLSTPVSEHIRCVYVLADSYAPSPFHRTVAHLPTNERWTVHRLPTIHHVMLTMPTELVELLVTP